MQDQVPVFSTHGKKTVPLPKTFQTPILPYLVTSVFTRLNMDTRQPYGVSPEAGKQHSAEGWGTGRAVARVPRVKGSGTRRAGQGAFANFCRKGRLAHPTKVTRKWKRKVNVQEKMQAMKVGIASTAVASLVEARGHEISALESIPCVISNEVLSISKTKDAVAFLNNLGLKDELSKEYKKTRAGIGKMRNRRYKKRRGVLLVHTGKEMLAFRNIPNLELMSIDEMCLKKISPGGHLGRLVVWTEDAFNKIDSIFENTKEVQTMVKYGPEIFYSKEVQALIWEKEYEDEKLVDRRISTLLENNPYLSCYNGSEVN